MGNSDWSTIALFIQYIIPCLSNIVSENLVNIVLTNDLLPDGTKQLPKPVGTLSSVKHSDVHHTGDSTANAQYISN